MKRATRVGNILAARTTITLSREKGQVMACRHLSDATKAVEPQRPRYLTEENPGTGPGV